MNDSPECLPVGTMRNLNLNAKLIAPLSFYEYYLYL